MKITVAENAGFCFGVARAVAMAEQLASQEEGSWCLGELTHNREVVAKLADRGLRAASSAEEVPCGASVLIRAHGEREEVFRILSARGCRVVDATCPRVAYIHKIVSRAGNQNRQVIVFGEPDHPEVRGICGWCSQALVVRSQEELDQLSAHWPDGRAHPITVVFQTTSNREISKQTINSIKKEYTNAEIFDTICNATSIRQEEARKLAADNDAVVVVGGKHSANTIHLADICREYCGRVLFVENASELDQEDLAGVSRVAVTAGASTPSWIIKEVVNKMSEPEILKEESNVETEPEEAVEQAAAAEEAPVEEQVAAEAPAEEETEEKAEQAPAEEAPAADEEPAAEETPAVDEEPAAEEESAPAEEEAPAEEAVEGQAQEEPAPAEESGEKSFDQLLEDSIRTLHQGETVVGLVAAISPTEITIDLPTKQSGYLPATEFTNGVEGADINELVKVGDEIQATVIHVNDMEGTVQLSKRRLDAAKNWEDIEGAYKEGTILEGKVSEENKGGVIVNVRGIHVFIPASRTGLRREEPMSNLVGKTVRFKITEVNRARKRVVGSIRDVLVKERKENAEKIWSEIEVGKCYHGVVKSMTSYGAFVDIGGVDGMVHVSEISWSHIRKPEDAFSIGQEVDVHVLGFDPEKRKISLGYRKEEDNPWLQFNNTYQVGDVATVKVVKLMPFGAFAEVIPGVDGLIHISQIADHRIGKPDEVLSVGQEVDAKITGIDQDKQKISLSIRALLEPDMGRSRQPRERRNESHSRGQNEPRDDALVYEVSATGKASGIAPEEDEVLTEE